MLGKNVVGGVTESVVLIPAAAASPGKASEMYFSGPDPDLLNQNL